ncbi:MAG: DUF2141 domain-containing protein [Candidatus Andeanibacterium colombiense]|uniref:DUF2141 domain-containing protein n=1 Tax=Candidatus Andeanibacterium colombiense TaxID=3121345 RepID=A0AAJ5X8H8_9SPHN|nr:MAG: DUF2141 domain-containing protein [Sphingomonadaceae bacterium]
MKHPLFSNARGAKTLFIPAAGLLAIGLAAAPAQAEECTGTPSATKMYVDVQGVLNSNGLIAVTLYADNSKKFLAKHGSLYVGRVPAKAGTTRVCIYVPKPAVYAIAVYHDVDGNRKFNRSGIGFPAEPYGFANNASTLAGLPSFKSVRISVPRDGFETSIRLKQP